MEQPPVHAEQLPVDVLLLIFTEADLSDPHVCRKIFNTCTSWRSYLIKLLFRNAGLPYDEAAQALVSDILRKSLTDLRGSNMADSVTIMLNIICNCSFMSNRFVPSILTGLRQKSVDSLFQWCDFFIHTFMYAIDSYAKLIFVWYDK